MYDKESLLLCLISINNTTSSITEHFSCSAPIREGQLLYQSFAALVTTLSFNNSFISLCWVSKFFSKMKCWITNLLKQSKVVNHLRKWFLTEKLSRSQYRSFCFIVMQGRYFSKLTIKARCIVFRLQLSFTKIEIFFFFFYMQIMLNIWIK